MHRSPRGGVIAVCLVALVLAGHPTQARAADPEERVRRLAHHLAEVRETVRRLRQAASVTDRRVEEARLGPLPARGIQARAESERVRTRLALRTTARERLRRRRRRAVVRLDALGPLFVCPVRGPVAVSDDFGAPRWDDGRYHAHQGNDLTAPAGTPIVAPFDGTAEATSSALGGIAVFVRGDDGYVYNAHLSAYERLGRVTTGTVVGYVGATGNATGPHDHFEWHPHGGPAVDPHALLQRVCRTE